MPAHEHLSPHQYKLFMTAQEIKDTVTDSVDRELGYMDYNEEHGELEEVPAQTMDYVWNEKLEESKRETAGKPKPLYDSIAEKGVRHHVTIVPDHKGSFTMGQGHHRVAAAADIAEKTGRQMYVPVVYDENFNYSDTDDYDWVYPQNNINHFKN